MNWQDFYQSDLQAVYALLVAPVAFLAYRLVVAPIEARAEVPAASRFVAGLTLFFAFETMLDPIATGPLLRNTGLTDTVASSLIPFFFVYLGDLRVLWLVSGVVRPDRPALVNFRWAALMTLIVPISAGIGFSATRWLFPDAHGQILWMLYEFGFLALCIWLGRSWLPKQVPAASGQSGFAESMTI